MSELKQLGALFQKKKEIQITNIKLNINGNIFRMRKKIIEIRNFSN